MSARRAVCIESCGSGPAVSRDPSCVNACNSKKTKRRKRAACIEHCPTTSNPNKDEIKLGNSSTTESEADHQAMDLSAYPKNDSSTIDNFSLPYLLPHEDLSAKNESTIDDIAVDIIVTKTMESTSISLDDVVTTLWQNETSSSNEPSVKKSDVTIDNQNITNTSELSNVSKGMVEATSKRRLDHAFNENKTNSLNGLEEQANDDVISTPCKGNEISSFSMVPTNTDSASSIANFTSHQSELSSRDIMSRDDDMMTRDLECVNSCTKKRTLQRKRDACLERCRVLKNEKDVKYKLNDSASHVSILTRGRGSATFEL